MSTFTMCQLLYTRYFTLTPNQPCNMSLATHTHTQSETQEGRVMRSRHTASKIQHPCRAKSLSQGLLGAVWPFSFLLFLEAETWRLIGCCDVETVRSVSLVFCNLFSKIISCRIKYSSFFLIFMHIYHYT